MVKIRLMRMGAKKNPHYRVVVIDSRKKRSGNYIDLLGHYDPRDTTPEPLKIDVELAESWLAKGAQPTDRALRLLETAGVQIPANLEAKKRDAYLKRIDADTQASA